MVHFLGPRTAVTADESAGRFTARGAAGVRVTADALVDAFLPTATLTHSTNPLLRALIDEATAVGREAVTSPGTLEVDARHRVIRPDGSAHETLWALGPWTSEMPLGAFARPRTDAPCHRRNDALALELLAAAQRRAAAPPGRGAAPGVGPSALIGAGLQRIIVGRRSRPEPRPSLAHSAPGGARSREDRQCPGPHRPAQRPRGAGDRPHVEACARRAAARRPPRRRHRARREQRHRGDHGAAARGPRPRPGRAAGGDRHRRDQPLGRGGCRRPRRSPHRARRPRRDPVHQRAARGPDPAGPRGQDPQPHRLPRPRGPRPRGRPPAPPRDRRGRR